MTQPSPAPSTRPTQPDDAPPQRYTAALASSIEGAWQDRWEREKTFAAPNPGEAGFDGTRPKRYVLDMFPYPSGVGLHVGHPLGYIATDIHARYLRMAGFNVLHAMGFDAFGLPAEEYARETGTHPRITTERNMATMRRQLRRLGLAHDDRRGVATIDPAYYKWTQWIFLKIYNSWYDDREETERRRDGETEPGERATGRARPISELVHELESGAIATRSGRVWSVLSADQKREEIDTRRLAYLAEAPVNWCPRLGTVLANEEVTADGRSERGNHPVFKRPMKQWMMRITAYAERLAADLGTVDWPESVTLMQRNWIGRSEGAFIDFEVAGDRAQGTARKVRVFTTRPDTIFGATYMVLSPEHPLVDAITADSWGSPAVAASWKGSFPGAPAGGFSTPRDAVAAYRRHAAAAAKAADDRSDKADKAKTGVFTGTYATNPATGKPIPIFIADYVLMGYGTGAIMSVPSHDRRDHVFALKFGLPQRPVVAGNISVAYLHLPPGFVRTGAEEAGWASSYNLINSAPTLLGFSSHAEAQRFSSEILRRNDLRIDLCQETTVIALNENEGRCCNSQGSGFSLDGMTTAEARAAVGQRLLKTSSGEPAISYKLRDWLFSRQRYWGEPFPIVFDEKGVPHDLPESMLPVVLPDLADFSPAASDDPDAPPTPPLGRAKEWVTVELDLGQGRKKYRRETNTMPNWAGSCWYYLRYLDPENSATFCAPDVECFWMAGQTPSRTTQHAARSTTPSGGVDLYVGGVEHAVLHLLYARFWHKVLYDLGYVSTHEPFQKLFNQGYIQAAAYTDERGVYVEASEVEERGGKFFHKSKPVTREFGKMGKSLKNAVTPDDVCRDYGCDTLRVYEMSMGPLEASKPWNTRDIAGAYRFLQRVWRHLIDEGTGTSRVNDGAPDAGTLRLLHKTIKGVRQDLDRLAFNTPVTKLIILNDHLGSLGGGASGGGVPRPVARAMILMLAPYAPHIAEELWQRCGFGTRSLAYEPFPVADDSLAADDVIELPVSINGKVRGHIRVSPDADAKTVEAAALAEPKVIEHTAGKTVKKIIVVPKKMVNVVVA
ncbi:MAG: leucine--tRNA ligase [Phycisphaerales bacterium]